MRFLFIIDPISILSPKKDTSLAFMAEACRRGHEVLACRIGDLAAYGDKPVASVKKVTVDLEATSFYVWDGGETEVDLRDLDAVLMRKDPPFNMEYIYATYILSLAEGHARIVNGSQGLRDCNEKAYILRFPQFTPPTLVTRSRKRIAAFVQEHKDAVIKPLDGKGGEGILRMRAGDRNNNSIAELLTQYSQRTIMMQAYVPEAREGDKRILLVDGKPLAAFLRVPAGDDLRGNMSAGATVEAAPITERDLEVCNVIGPALMADGHIFAGIDLLGPYLTEINVTSPTGVHEAKALAGVDVSAALIDALEAP